MNDKQVSTAARLAGIAESTVYLLENGSAALLSAGDVARISGKLAGSGEAAAPWRWVVEVENASPMASLLLIEKSEADTWSRRAGCTVFPVYRDAAPTDAQSRIAELEAQLAAVTRDRDLFAQSFNERGDRIADLEAKRTESREREGRMREALTSIAHSKNLTATPQQWADHLQREARAALAAEKEQK